MRFAIENGGLIAYSSEGDKDTKDKTIITIKGIRDLADARVHFLAFFNATQKVKDHIISGCPPFDGIMRIDCSLDHELQRRIFFNGVLISVLGVTGNSICTFQKGIRARTIVHDRYIPSFIMRDTSLYGK